MQTKTNKIQSAWCARVILPGGDLKANNKESMPDQLFTQTPSKTHVAKSLKTTSVIQRRLDVLKAVRFGRYVLNELVRCAS